MTQKQIEAFTVIAAFLVHAERDQPNMMYGSHTVGEAIDSLAQLLSCPRDTLRTLGDI